jgi:26S proteasome regulatory subunit T5
MLQVVAATNRIDILDPALLRSGRLDRKIEFPHPTEEARARILQIHSRKMNVSDGVNYEELARCTDDFNGAQLKVRSYCVVLLSGWLCDIAYLLLHFLWF